MIQKAVIDWFEGDYAVISIGNGERRLKAHREALPEGCQKSTWLNVEFKGDDIIKIEIDLEETAMTRDRIERKLTRLRHEDHRH